jgi:hypothetical protein
MNLLLIVRYWYSIYSNNEHRLKAGLGPTFNFHDDWICPQVRILLPPFNVPVSQLVICNSLQAHHRDEKFNCFPFVLHAAFHAVRVAEPVRVLVHLLLRLYANAPVTISQLRRRMLLETTCTATSIRSSGIDTAWVHLVVENGRPLFCRFACAPELHRPL